MKSKATLRDLRIAPRKVRLVADLIRGKRASEAATILRVCTKSAAQPLGKILRSALASAAYNSQMPEAHEENFIISQIQVAEGVKLKRFRPRARGRAYPIQKKTSRVTLILDEIVPSAVGSGKSWGSAKSGYEETRGERRAKGESFGAKQEKPKFRPAKETKLAKRETGVRRFFRRKAV